MFEELFTIPKKNVQDALESQQRLLKGIETLTKLERPKGGVSEKEVIYTEDKLVLYHFVPKVKHPLKTPTLISYFISIIRISIFKFMKVGELNF
ncbi:TPA: hypothetical protein ACGOSD_001270 [Streptococcus suis]